MTIDENVRDKKRKIILIQKQQKYQHCHQKKLVNMKILGEEIVPSDPGQTRE